MIDAMDRAADALDAAGCESVAVRAAAALLREPLWRVAVVGRVSAGKSSLVNAIARERRQDVGLGGVTREATEVVVGAVMLVDTPGIDAADRAIGALAPVVDQADAVIWVVDGLQPVTDTERRVLTAIMPPGTPLDVVVSRLDLVADDAEDVLERVCSLSAPFLPRSVRRLDLRGATQAPPELVAAVRPSPRRVRSALLALEEARDRLDALPSVPSPQALRARWREIVRGVEERVLASSPSRREVALSRLAREAAAARDGFVAAVPGVPRLPAPERPEAAGFGQLLLDNLAGSDAVRREVRAQVARWLIDGEVALAEWAERAGVGETGRRRELARGALVGAIDRYRSGNRDPAGR